MRQCLVQAIRPRSGRRENSPAINRWVRSAINLSPLSGRLVTEPLATARGSVPVVLFHALITKSGLETNPALGEKACVPS
jgi:hypothetical protein